MNAQQPIVEPDAPETWRESEHAPISDQWLEWEQRDAEQRAWLEQREAETAVAACLI